MNNILARYLNACLGIKLKQPGFIQVDFECYDRSDNHQYYSAVVVKTNDVDNTQAAINVAKRTLLSYVDAPEEYEFNRTFVLGNRRAWDCEIK